MNHVKFNIDGAIEGRVGKAGIGGILRNSENVTLIMFSKAIGFSDATSAELCVIREALVLFVESKWSKQSSLILEIDCTLCAGWLRSPTLAPVSFKILIADILILCAGRAGFSWSIQIVHREANSTADLLAKKRHTSKLSLGVEV
ncbi:hypothetical protein V6N11_043029 [Hibiscus sabdariffa]|uniref:RNase H type-1 domain-containing protein n=1 Tax=Hibiscus sabdariffa TaxID=183260 RepID=A0ABR2QYB6_9ROSI